MKRRIQSPKAGDTADFGSTIRAARERLGMSQEELAGHIDLTDAQVSRLEHGLNTTDAERVVKLGRILGLNSTELLRMSGYRLVAEELYQREQGLNGVGRGLHATSFIPPKDVEALKRVVAEITKPGSGYSR